MSDDAKDKGIFVQKKSSAKPAAGQTAAKPKNVKQRWLMIGGGFLGVVIIASTVFGDKPTGPVVAAKKDVPKIDVTPPNAEKKAFEANFGEQLSKLTNAVKSLEAENATKDQRLKELTLKMQEAGARSGANGAVPPPVQGGSTNTGAIVEPPAPIRRDGMGVKQDGATPSLPAISVNGTPDASVAPPVIKMAPAPLVFEPPSDTPQPQSKNGSESGNATSTALNSLKATVNAKSSYTANKSAGTLPMGSFVEISLLNGIDAATSTAAASDPMPVLMNVTDNATLPGSAKYKIKNCFLLGTGYGNMSAERVYIRTSRISCVDKRNKLILTQDAPGYVVDSDGKLGMRGMVTDRQGAKLGKALLAGFASGLANALGSAQSTVSTSSLTGGTTSTISGSAALKASGLAGAQSATSQLADFYLKEAQSMFPVITLDSGRLGTVVFTANAQLVWADGENQYVQEIKPDNSNK